MLQDLDPKLINALEELRREFNEKLARQREEFENLVDLAAPSPEPAPEPVDAAAPSDTELGPLEELKLAAAEIDRADSQAAVLDALVRGASRFAQRIAIFLCREDALQGWGGTGFGTNDATINGLSLDIPEDSSWTQVLAGDGGVCLAAADCAVIVDQIGGDEADIGVLIPFILRQQVAAVIYADRCDEGEAFNIAGLQLISFLAGQTVETLPIRERSATSSLALAGAAAEEVVAVEEPVAAEEAVPIEIEEPAAERPEIEPVEEAPIQEAPIEEDTVEETPVDEAPTAETPAQEPAEEEVSEEDTLDEITVAEVPIEDLTPEEPPVDEADLEHGSVEGEEEAVAVAEEEPAPESMVSEETTEPLDEDLQPSPEPLVEEPTAAEEAPVASEDGAPVAPAEAEPAPAVASAEEETSPGMAAAEEEDSETQGAAGTQVRPPQDVDGPGWAFTTTRIPSSAGAEALHEEARRLARLLVTEIKLYNEEIVEEGRRAGDVYSRLREDIDRSRQIFEDRIDAEVRSEKDYFQEALVRILAGGDDSALGSPD